MKQLNFNNQKEKLSENDVDQIINIITYKCRIKTVNRVRSILTYHPRSIGSYGTLDRLIKRVITGVIVLVNLTPMK